MYLFYLAMKTPSGIMSLAILLYTVILSFICPALINKNKNAAIRILCVLPIIAAAVHFSIFRTLMFDRFIYLYLESILPLALLLPGKSKWFAAVKSVVSSLAVVGVCIFFLFNSINFIPHNYTRYSYTKSFKKMISTLSNEYCLSSWKKIDYDSLLDEFLPKVEEAEKNNDKTAFAKVLTEVTYRFYDAHVYTDLSEELDILVREELSGNDYGLSMIRLDDGSVIAACTEPDSGLLYDEAGIFGLNKIGIHDGTRILSWDGKDIDEAIESVECIYPGIEFPVKSNEDVLRPIFLAGMGGDSVKITFLDDDGNEREAELENHGSYNNRLSWAYSKLFGYDAFGDNFYSDMIDDKCGYLSITSENYDNFLDAKAVIKKGYYPELTEYCASIIKDLEDKGMKYLVIDVRNNMGGSDFVAGALASLFTNKKIPLCSFGYEDQSGYHSKENHNIFPDGRYSNLPVVVLVNCKCMSAGDGLAKFMGDCPSVTLMGMTASAGVNQNDGGCIYLADDICVKYPSNLTLTFDGKPLIDTDDTRENRVPLDVQIPMTKEYALQLFNYESHDPELDYAVEYLENKAENE